MMDDFGSCEIQFELAIVCDLVLDVFRYKTKAIVDAVNAVTDYKTSVKKG